MIDFKGTGFGRNAACLKYTHYLIANPRTLDTGDPSHAYLMATPHLSNLNTRATNGLTLD